MNVKKDVRIRGYFSKPEGIRERKILGNTALVCINVTNIWCHTHTLIHNTYIIQISE